MSRLWIGLRACLKITNGPVFGPKAGWRGATKEHTPGGSSTEEQRSQAAFGAKTLPPSLKLRRTGRAAGLLSVACVGSFLTARFGDARNSPPWPRPKSPAAGPFVIFKQALKISIQSNRVAAGLSGQGEGSASERRVLFRTGKEAEVRERG